MPFLDSRVTRPGEMGSDPLVARNGNSGTSPSEHLGGHRLADSPYISFSSNIITSLVWWMIGQMRPRYRREKASIVIAQRPESAMVVDSSQRVKEAQIKAQIGPSRPAEWAIRNREVLYRGGTSLIGWCLNLHGASALAYTLHRIISPTGYSDIDDVARSIAVELGQTGLSTGMSLI